MARKKTLKVDGSQTLVRDTESKAILNTDVQGLQAARAAKQRAIDSHKNIEAVEQLTTRVDGIETLLQTLLDEVKKLNSK